MALFNIPQSAVGRAALTVGIAIMAALMQWAIYPWVGSRVPYLFFLPAIVLTTFMLGRGAALVVLATGLANSMIVLPPTGRFQIAAEPDQVVLLAYIAVGLALIYVCGHFALVRKRVDALLDDTRTELMQQVADLQGLHELSTRLLAINDLRQQLQVILEAAAEFHGTNRGLMSLLDSENMLEVEASIGFSAEALSRLVNVPLGTGACGNACALKRRVVVQDTETDEVSAPCRALSRVEGFRAVHSTPIVNLAGEVMGALSVHWAEPRVPTEREIRLAEICANKAAMFIERYRAQLVARESNRRFRVALESSAVPFVVLAPVRENGNIVDFRWTYVNQAAAAVYHRAQDFLIGKRVCEVLPDNWIDTAMVEHYIAVAVHGDTREFEVFRDNAGVHGWFHVVASPLDGSVAIWFADVTARKLQEQELKEADRRKDEFLATLAHELRNPLAPVRQAADVLRLPGSTEEQKRRSLDVIERQVGNMALLLDDLLEVSRITRGMLALRKRDVELHAVIDAALEAAQPLIDKRRHSVTLDLPPHETWFEADELRLAQIVANLLTNAAKYTDEGGTIRIAAERKDEDIVIRVRDSGIGIEQEALHEIFRMFARVKNASAYPAGGLGIGLALAKGLVELHGGSIEAWSDGAGKGSEFTVRLPAGQASGRVSELAPADTVDTTDIAPARRILIADDNRDAAESLGTLLELLGHEVAVTFDGEEALMKFAEFQPEVALLDLGMPGLSGTELARAIRHRPDGKKAILIAVTGWGQERDKQLAYDAGFDHHLTKPIDPKQLVRMLAGEREHLAL